MGRILCLVLAGTLSTFLFAGEGADRQNDPAEVLRQIEQRLQETPEDPMLHYRRTQYLMALGRRVEGYAAAKMAMAKFIAADNDLAWMGIDRIDLPRHRVDVHFNMGPRERRSLKMGISRPLSFRVWTKEDDAKFVDEIDFEIGWFKGKPATAAFGWESDGVHANLGMVDPGADYPQIRSELEALVRRQLGYPEQEKPAPAQAPDVPPAASAAPPADAPGPAHQPSAPGQ